MAFPAFRLYTETRPWGCGNIPFCLSPSVLLFFRRIPTNHCSSHLPFCNVVRTSSVITRSPNVPRYRCNSASRLLWYLRFSFDQRPSPDPPPGLSKPPPSHQQLVAALWSRVWILTEPRGSVAAWRPPANRRTWRICNIFSNCATFLNDDTCPSEFHYQTRGPCGKQKHGPHHCRGARCQPFHAGADLQPRKTAPGNNVSSAS